MLFINRLPLSMYTDGNNFEGSLPSALSRNFKLEELILGELFHISIFMIFWNCGIRY